MLADEARVGGNNVGRVRFAADDKELAVRNADGIGDATHRRIVRRGHAGDLYRLRRWRATGARTGTHERDPDIAARRPHRQLDRLRGHGLVIGRSTLRAPAAMLVRENLRTRTRDGAGTGRPILTIAGPCTDSTRLPQSGSCRW